MLLTYFFQFFGDFFRYFSVSYILFLLIRRKSCTGISGRSQILFAVCYATSNAEIWNNLLSSENWIKMIYVGFSYVTVCLIYVAFRGTYQKEKDVFLTEILIIPSFMLAVWSAKDLTPTGIVQAFSFYLEAVAILPQFYMILEKRTVEKCLLPYLVGQGLYKVMYICYWLTLYQIEGYYDPIAAASGVIYMLFYLLALIEYFFVGVTVTVEGNNKYLRANIFLIGTKEPLTDRLNLLNNDQLSNEKKEVDEQQTVEKTGTS